MPRSPCVHAGFYVFVRALQLLKSHNDGVITVGLAGPSGSGKTSFSERIKSFMPGVYGSRASPLYTPLTPPTPPPHTQIPSLSLPCARARVCVCVCAGVVVISMDMYNDGSKIVHQNFDDPRLVRDIWFVGAMRSAGLWHRGLWQHGDSMLSLQELLVTGLLCMSCSGEVRQGMSASGIACRWVADLCVSCTQCVCVCVCVSCNRRQTMTAYWPT